MTERKENIVYTALKLFAQKGVDATSTSSIAREAGVSEGLIFRHFKNKEGLLEEIIAMGKMRALHKLNVIRQLTDPKEVLRAIITLPFDLRSEEHDFWKLLYAVKWQADAYDDSISQPVRELLTDTFNTLGYDNPETESDVVLLILDGIATAVLLRKPPNTTEWQQSILKKYDLL